VLEYFGLFFNVKKHNKTDVNHREPLIADWEGTDAELSSKAG
jgi:hypothetical protein